MLMRPRLHRATIGALLLIATFVSACAQNDDGTGSPNPGSTMPNIVINKTGGIAGINDTYTVDSSGLVTHTNRAGATTTATLSAGQRTQLIQLAADSRLAAEAQHQASATNCRDAFNYVVRVGALTVAYTDCPSDPDQPVAAKALVSMVTSIRA
jgi:hypothetical protein